MRYSEYKGLPPNVLIIVSTTGISDESSKVTDASKRSIEHYLIPSSTRWAYPETRFYELKQEWEEGTIFLSSVRDICMHPAYQQIIGMGPVAIPLILSELEKKPAHWFWALKSITGEDPIVPEERGRIRQMAEAWLNWGKKHGYLE